MRLTHDSSEWLTRETRSVQLLGVFSKHLPPRNQRILAWCVVTGRALVDFSRRPTIICLHVGRLILATLVYVASYAQC